MQSGSFAFAVQQLNMLLYFSSEGWEVTGGSSDAGGCAEVSVAGSVVTYPL